MFGKILNKMAMSELNAAGGALRRSYDRRT